jgi:hypothetical protein
MISSIWKNVWKGIANLIAMFLGKMMMMSRVERCTMFRQISANQPDTLQQIKFLAGERR